MMVAGERVKLLTKEHLQGVRVESHRLLLLLATMRLQQGLVAYEKRPNDQGLAGGAANADVTLAAGRALEGAGLSPRRGRRSSSPRCKKSSGLPVEFVIQLVKNPAAG